MKILITILLLIFPTSVFADSYKILAVKNSGDTIITEVEYTINGIVEDIAIPHFEPQSVNDVETGILNRLVSEKAKLTASTKVDQIIPLIEIGKTIDVQ